MKKKLEKEIKIYAIFNADLFPNLFYRSPITPDVAYPFVASEHVKASMGTGLVHTSYAHGFDDYKVYLIKIQ